MFEYPVIAFSKAGWVKEVESESEGFDASPDDNLSEWQNMVIYDSSGKKFHVKNAYLDRHGHTWRLWLNRLFKQSVYVEFDIDIVEDTSLDELKQNIAKHYGELSGLISAQSYKEVIELCL